MIKTDNKDELTDYIEKIMDIDLTEGNVDEKQISEYRDWLLKIRDEANRRINEGTLDIDELFYIIDEYFREVSEKNNSDFTNTPIANYVLNNNEKEFEQLLKVPFYQEMLDIPGKKGILLEKYDGWMNKIKGACKNEQNNNRLNDSNFIFSALCNFYSEIKNERKYQLGEYESDDNQETIKR